MQGKVAVLEDRAAAHGEGFPAGVAFSQPRSAALASQAADALALAVAAMGANRTFRPKVRLDVDESGIFVVKMWGG